MKYEVEVMKKISIAVDGPAGAGKSTVAKQVAKNFGIVYVDTGAMYRTAALFAIENGINIKEERDKLISRLDDIKIDIEYKDGEQRMFLDGRDVTGIIRTEQVSMGASLIAVIPEVRIKLVDMQRELAKSKSVIMDGRDIGTYVLPDADIKIFLTASPECRANRRFNELLQKGMECDYNEVLADIKARDKNDSEREFAPLRCAEDAVLLDSTALDREQVIEKISEMINEFLKG